MNLLNFSSFLPELTTILLVLVISIYRFLDLKKQILYPITFFTTALLIMLLIIQQFYFSQHLYYSSNVAFDSFGSYLKLFLIIGIAIGALIDASREDKSNGALYVIYALILFSSFMAVSSNNLLLTFVTFELLHLAYLNLLKFDSAASIIKIYYRSWIISSSLMLFGISLLYGLFGSLNYSLISYYISNNPVNTLTLTFSVLLMFSGFAMKLFAFPLQSAAINVFSTLNTGKLQIVILSSIISGSSSLFRFISTAFNDWNSAAPDSRFISGEFNWELFLSIYFIISILSSSLILYLQKETLKSLLIFILINSSFLIISVFGNGHPETGNFLFYLIFVVISVTGLMLVLKVLSSNYVITEFKDLKGLYRHAKWEILFLILILLSSTGLPLTMGFTAKLYILNSLNSVLFVIISSLISAFVSSLVIYKLIVSVFSYHAQQLEDTRPGITFYALVIVIILAIVLSGIFPWLIKDAFETARLIR